MCVSLCGNCRKAVGKFSYALPNKVGKFCVTKNSSIVDMHFTSTMLIAGLKYPCEGSATSLTALRAMLSLTWDSGTLSLQCGVAYSNSTHTF